jgi:hypothetical protein
MRHLVKAHSSGFMLAGRSGTIAELGPGDSLGIGLAAMLSGFDKYLAFDAKVHANTKRNLAVFQELLQLFLERTRVPGEGEFPQIYPRLDDYSFPSQILTDRILKSALDPQRTNAIMRAIQSLQNEVDGAIRIDYIAPWLNADLFHCHSVDIIFSQAVLEHIDDIVSAYKRMYEYLRPGGLMSHTIDFESHGITRDWYGHWTVSDACWYFIRGKRPYLINRMPHSTHIGAIKQAGFRVIMDEARHAEAPERLLLARRFVMLSGADLATSGAFIQAIKPGQ